MKTKIISILALLLTVTQGAWAAEAFTGSGSGTPGDPYVISNNEEYWAFVHNVNDGMFTTQYFKLNYSPVSIESSIGTADHPFQGHFDGNGNTAGLSINTENSYVALFAYASGATIENLHVNGTVTTSNIYAAGLIANATNVTITNCRSSVTINSSYNGGGGHAGFVGLAAGTITITGCLFDGTLATTNGTTQCSGFIGWSDATTTAITNSLCVPASVTSGMEGYDFVRPLHSPAVTNSYASESFNVSYRHGKILRSISAGTDVTSLGISGASTEYSVSGITAYATGIKYNGVYYAGNGESVSLALSHDDKAGYTFNQYAVAGGGTLTAQTETSATLSMTDANQTINAQWTANTYSVHFNGNGSTSGSMDNESFTYDEAKTLTTNAFSRTGYTFDGWATTADGDVAYTDGQSVSNLTAENGATVELFAHWSSNTTTSGIDWNPATDSGTFLMPAYNVEVSTELWYKVDEEKTPAENAAYGTKSDFFLNRTLTANVWNTFASPFAIAAGDMTKYFGAGAKVRQLNTTSVAENVLTLNFEDATSIVAGQPYLVKPAANVDFSADGKEFAGVDLTAASATPTATTYVNFIPTLGKTAVTGDPKDILILNASGTLVHPSAAGNMKGFRGYFVMHEETASLARAFVINFGEGETTGIQPIRMENGTTPAEGTYDLSGRRIQGQPTQKGVYIQNGKKVVIK